MGPDPTTDMTGHTVEEYEMKTFKSFLADQRGTEVVEWAMLIGIIAVGIIAIVLAIGAWALDKFSALNTGLATT